MGNLVITGASAQTFKALINNPTGTADKYYLRCPLPGGEVRAWQRRTAPAVDGTKRKDGGFRMRQHGPFRVLIVAASEGALETSFQAIKSALEGRVSGCTIAYPGGVISADECFLVDGYPRQVTDRDQDPASTNWYVEVELLFEEN